MSKVFPTIYAFGWPHVKLGQHSEKLEIPTPIEKQKPPAESQQTQQWRLPKKLQLFIEFEEILLPIKTCQISLLLLYFHPWTLLLFTFLHWHSSLKSRQKTNISTFFEVKSKMNNYEYCMVNILSWSLNEVLLAIFYS